MKLVNDLIIPEPNSSNKGKLQISGSYWSLGTLLSIYTLSFFMIWGLLYIATYSPGENQFTAFYATGVIASTIYVASVIGILRYVDDHLLGLIISHNKQISTLDRPKIPRSLLFYISRYNQKPVKVDKYNDPKIAYGYYGTTTQDSTYSVGRLVNTGPYKNYACATLELSGTIGHCIVDASRDESGRNIFNFKKRIDGMYNYDLEGPFVEQFDVYAPHPDAVRALTYVLTPNLMQQILDIAPSVDIEFIDNIMIIIWPEKSLDNRQPDWPKASYKATHILNEVAALIGTRIETFTKHSAENNQKITKGYIQISELGSLIQSTGERRLQLINLITKPEVFIALIFIILLIAGAAVAVTFNVNIG